jgi:hypothetical protein
MAGQNAKAEKARQAELYVKAISNIVASLVSLVEAGKPVALRRLIADHCAALKVQRTPKQVDILAAVPQRHRKMVLPVVRTKPVRSSSGVAIVAVMSKPHVCPHVHHTGNVCVYCPGGPDSDFEYRCRGAKGKKKKKKNSNFWFLNPVPHLWVCMHILSLWSLFLMIIGDPLKNSSFQYICNLFHYN